MDQSLGKALHGSDCPPFSNYHKVMPKDVEKRCLNVKDVREVTTQFAVPDLRNENSKQKVWQDQVEQQKPSTGSEIDLK